MGHLAARPAYAHLVDRLNRFPQGAPPTDLLFQILQLLFTEAEAELEATAHTVRLLEEMIRRYPEQWFWMHRRWKTRPAEEPMIKEPNPEAINPEGTRAGETKLEKEVSSATDQLR